jgi:signal transduction histidine kinase
VATSVAHELRSPLGGIIRSTEFLARSELSDNTRKKLGHSVVALARRLINTTQEILDYTQGGRMNLRLAPCGLPEFLEQVIEVLKVDFSDQGIEVIEEWDYTGQVQMDSDRMAQVVYNIAANARDAMPEGGRLTIAVQQANGWVELRFTDTGHGVPSELVERIFEPFVSYGKREGAGLGLAIARRIVQEHGGEIDVESPAEGGATFRVRLPLREQTTPVTHSQAPAEPTPAV